MKKFLVSLMSLMMIFSVCFAFVGCSAGTYTVWGVRIDGTDYEYEQLDETIEDQAALKSMLKIVIETEATFQLNSDGTAVMSQIKDGETVTETGFWEDRDGKFFTGEKEDKSDFKEAGFFEGGKLYITVSEGYAIILK